MTDYSVLSVIQTIVTAGQHVLQGVATGTVRGTISDDGGLERVVSFHAVVVPGMGANLFSVTEAMRKGVATIFHPDKPRLEVDDIVLPMNLLGADERTGKLLCSIKVELGGVTGGFALRAESADLWHRSMGHINHRSMDVRRKLPGNIIEYAGDLQACDVCAVGKSNEQAHPKQATHDVEHAFQLVTVDLMGPINPAALGGYLYETKYVDQHTKWKEMFLINTKTQTIDALELFNKALVVPQRTRLIRLRADKGTEFTSSEFRQYCLDIGVKLEFASPNTPQQIGSNERAGRTIAGIVRCLLDDSGLPHFLWGELLQTAVYLSNRAPHPSLADETPHKALYGKGDNSNAFGKEFKSRSAYISSRISSPMFGRHSLCSHCQGYHSEYP